MCEKNYLFVLCDKGLQTAGWWLKLTSAQQVLEYLAITEEAYKKALENFMKDSFYQKSVIGHGPHIHEAPLTLACWLHGVNRSQSMIDAIANVAGQKAVTMLEGLSQTGSIYVNRNGGFNWHMATSESGSFVRRKDPIFPEYEKNQIRIKSFPGGTHFYAYVDDTQVRDGGILKWDSYEKAHAQAMLYVMDKK